MGEEEGLLQVLEGYLKCARWSSTDDKDIPYDDAKYNNFKFTKESIDKAQAEVIAFLEKAKPFLKEKEYEKGLIGHDFWLTRNRAGVGFWDRPFIYGQHSSEQLTKIAHQFNGCWLTDWEGELFFL